MPFNGSADVTLSPTIKIAGTGYGEPGAEAAVRGAESGFTSTLNGSVTMTANSTVGSHGGTLVFNSGIAGDYALTIGASSLTGTVVLKGASTYTGNTTVSYGTFQVGGSGTLGTSASYAGNIANNAAFKYSSSADQTLTGVISGAGTLTKDTGTSSKLIQVWACWAYLHFCFPHFIFNFLAFVSNDK